MSTTERPFARCRAAAHELIDEGLSVFLCWSPVFVEGQPVRCTCGSSTCSIGKHPIGALFLHGVLNATSDHAQVDDAFDRYPEANLAMSTRGLIVLDFDPDRGGLEDLSRLEVEHGPLDVRRHLTGEHERGRGVHLIWRQVNEPVGSRKLPELPGTDVKADGGYVMVPPSMHRSGAAYERVDPTEILVAPPWLVELLAPRAPRTGAGTPNGSPGTFGEALLRQPSVREGDGRNPLMTELLGPFAGRVSESVYRQLADLFNRQFAEPLPDAEVDKIATSIWRREGGRRGIRIAEEAETMRVRLAARELVDREHASALFQPPEFRPSLADDLVVTPESPPETIAGVHLTGANALIAAQYKAGKSTLGLNLIRSLVDGVPFLGAFDVNFEGRVALLNYELAEAQLIDWLRSMGIVHPERVTTVNLRGVRLPIWTEPAQTWVVEFLSAHEVHALIVDPFARAFAGAGDENDNSQVGAFVDALDAIKALAEVPDLFLTHHLGRRMHEEGAEHGRGATRLDDWADARWVLVRQLRDRFLTISGRGVDVPESRLRFDPETLLLTLEEGSREDARQEARDFSIEFTTGLLLEAVKAEPGISRRDLEQRLKGTSKATISEAIKQAIERGKIETKRGPHNTMRYFLAPPEIKPENPQGKLL